MLTDVQGWCIERAKKVIGERLARQGKKGREGPAGGAAEQGEVNFVCESV